MLPPYGVSVAHVERLVAARSLADGPFHIADYLPAVAIAVVVVALAVTIVIFAMRRRDAE